MTSNGNLYFGGERLEWWVSSTGQLAFAVEKVEQEGEEDLEMLYVYKLSESGEWELSEGYYLDRGEHVAWYNTGDTISKNAVVYGYGESMNGDEDEEEEEEE